MAGVRLLGLTGGIGSGKSTVAALLAACGAHRVDVDAIAHALTRPGGGAIADLREAFGDDAIDATGALDRDRMRALVFTDPGAKARLEAILHPLIGRQALAEAEAARPEQAVVFDVPLLTESRHWRTRVQRILVVDCDEATQIERVAARPGWSRDAAARVIAQQASRPARRAIADAVIHNVGLTLPALEAEVRALHDHWFGA